MELQQHLDGLEEHQDWYGLAKALDEGLSETHDNAVKAGLHLRLGRVLRDYFLQGVKALKHFQDAHKHDPTLTVALSEAQHSYGQLGKLNMVQKLLGLQIKVAAGREDIARLHKELGDALCDQGHYDRAAAAYATALECLPGTDSDLPQRLGDVQTSESQWHARVAAILRLANSTIDPESKSIAFTRAARIVKRYAPAEAEGILAQAYVSNFKNVSAVALLENILVESGRTEAILRIQHSAIESLVEASKLSAFLAFGARWAIRHHNVEVAGQFLLEAFRRDPNLAQVPIYLRDHSDEWPSGHAGILSVVDSALETRGWSVDTRGTLAVAGLIAGQDLKDVSRAKSYWDRLASVDATHPILSLLRGHSQLPAQVTSTSRHSANERPSETISTKPMLSRFPVQRTIGSSNGRAVALDEEHPVSAIPEVEARRQDEDKVTALREQLRQQEEGKRFHELVNTLMALGDELADPIERTDLYMRAADLYVSKFANQAEAVRAYEKVIECDPMNPVALDYLRQMYEKRRDWEKLVALSFAQAREAEPGPERTSMLKDIAKLATERIKKPEVCVELWNEILKSDSTDVEALTALAQLHERARDFARLANVLEQLAELSFDSREKIQFLNKLALVVGDRLNDDARAVAAYQALLSLVPDDRRAQEQLKKRYVTLGRWDDLEVFYADSGKWDEFIRILEANEAKTEDVAQRIAMLLKVADLWLTQKGKTDRAARAYEKILQLDAGNLEAAGRLAPLYAAANNRKGLASALEVQLTHATGKGERLPLLRTVAKLYETDLNDQAQAFAKYLEAFGLDPNDHQSRTDAERTCHLTGQWGDLISAYRVAVGEAEQAGDHSAMLSLRLSLNLLLDMEAKDVKRKTNVAPSKDGAPVDAIQGKSAKDELTTATIDTCCNILSSDPKNTEAIAALERFAESDEHVVEVAQRLWPIYETQHNSEKLEQLSRAVLRVDPKNEPAFNRLSDTLSAAEQFAEVSALTQEFALACDDPDKTKNYLQHAALIEEEVLERHEEAIAIYQKIIELDPNDLTGIDSLIRLCLVRSKWSELLAVFSKKAELLEDPEEKKLIYYQVGAVYERELHDSEKAIDTYQRILEIDPDDIEALGRLDVLYQHTQDWHELLSVLAHERELVFDATEAKNLQHRIAETYEKHLGDLERAANEYRALLEVDPSHGPALEALVRIQKLLSESATAARLGATDIESPPPANGLMPVKPNGTGNTKEESLPAQRSPDKAPSRQLVVEVRMARGGTVSAKTGNDWSSGLALPVMSTVLHRVQEGNAQTQDVDRIGQFLFNVLNSCSGFTESYQALLKEATEDDPLRLVLRMMPDEEDDNRYSVGDLFWEMLHDLGNGLHLGTSANIRLVRDYYGMAPHAVPPAHAPLRLTVGFSNPMESFDGEPLHPLNLTLEQEALRKLEKQFPSGDVLNISVILRLGLDNFDEAVSHVQALHYSGHGRAGALELVAESGTSELLGTDALRNAIGSNNLSLCVLNCCRGGVLDDRTSTTAFAFLRGGVGFVIAMSGAFRDKSALKFTREFYLRLANGASVEAALQKARWRLFAEGATDWFMPTGSTAVPTAFALTVPNANAADAHRMVTQVAELDNVARQLAPRVVVMEQLARTEHKSNLSTIDHAQLVDALAMRLPFDANDLEAAAAELVQDSGLVEDIARNLPRSNPSEVAMRSTLSIVQAEVLPLLRQIASSLPALTQSLAPPVIQDCSNHGALDQFGVIADSEDPPLTVPHKKTFESLVLEVLSELDLPSSVAERCLINLLSGRHLVLTGPPGTGKSSLANKLAEAFGFEALTATANPDWTTFDVIGGPFPVANQDSSGRTHLSYSMRYGCVVNAVASNWKLSSDVNPTAIRSPLGKWLILDEMNRAPMDQAFGDLFTGLASSELSVPRVSNGSKQSQTTKLKIPKRFRIIGTLNTADRHLLFEMSEALKRRFAFVEVPAFEPGKWGVASPQKVVRQAQQRAAVEALADDRTHDQINEYLNLLGPIVERVRVLHPLGTAQVVDALVCCFVGGKLQSGTPAQVMDTILPDQFVPVLESQPPDKLKLLAAFLLGDLSRHLRARLERLQSFDEDPSTPLRRSLQELARFLEREGSAEWQSVANSLSEQLQSERPDWDSVIQKLEPGLNGITSLPGGNSLATALREVALCREH